MFFGRNQLTFNSLESHDLRSSFHYIRGPLIEKGAVTSASASRAQYRLGNPTHGSGWMSQTRPTAPNVLNLRSPTNGSWRMVSDLNLIVTTKSDLLVNALGPIHKAGLETIHQLLLVGFKNSVRLV